MDYLITFRTYGTWLHGDERGSVDAEHNQPGEPLREPHSGLQRAMRESLRSTPVVFDDAQRACVWQTIEEVAEHRHWNLQAIAVQSNHVHLVIGADAAPEKVMNDLKAWSTRRLRESQFFPADASIWSSHGSTRYLNTSVAIRNACRYVNESQTGDPDYEPEA